MEGFYVVGEEGLEPSCLAAPAPKAGVSANFTTRPGEVGAVYEQVLKRATPSGNEWQRLF